MTPRRANRWLLYGPLAVGAALFAAYSVAWGEGAAAMRRSIDKFADKQRQHGVEIAYDGVATRGYPFLLRGVAPNISVEGGDWSWRAPALYVDALPLAPDRLVFSTREGQHFDLGEYGVWTLDAEDGRASIRDDDARNWALDMESGKARLKRQDGDERTVELERFLLALAPNSKDHSRIETSLVANGLATKGATRTVGANAVEAAFALGAADSLGDADAWREAGGDLVLRRIAIEAEGGRLYLAGVLTLDADGFPEGTLDAEIVNPAVFALALGELGVIARDEADAAAAALALIALAGGGKIAAPLVLKDGRATIAGVRIAKLPRVR